ncbi:MAG: peptidoglycan-binding protein [Myxococcaceae bacterium]|nr:peptidoglycan-binding protein [Myxococcaceae bacterium]
MTAAATLPLAVARTSSGELRRGATGLRVRELQQKLRVLGYLSEADVASGPGVFGPRTEKAVMAFQADHGLKRIGVVGRYTQAALEKALAENFPPTGSRNTLGSS